MRFDISKFKKLGSKIFEIRCEKGHYTLKFHLLAHISGDMSQIGALELQNCSDFERFSAQVKIFYCRDDSLFIWGRLCP